MRKYAIVDYFGYDLPPMERLRAIKQAGFDGVLLLWADYFDADYRDFPKYADKLGLFVENAHAPYRHSNSIWADEASSEGDDYAAEIIRCVWDCKEYGIPTLVIHPHQGTERTPPREIGIRRLRRIVDAAERAGVNLAIENQGAAEYVGYVFEQIQSGRLGFCYDSGHAHFYSPETDLLDLYGNRLMALHLHDNNGSDDAHALPFAGSINWSSVTEKLNAIRYRGTAALETLNVGFEQIENPVEFLQLALDRAKRIL